jgi:hypothetical protein
MMAPLGSFCRNLNDLDRRSLRAPNHVCGAATARKRDNEIWFSSVKHFLVADWAGSIAVHFPICGIADYLFTPDCSPHLSFIICTAGASMDDVRDASPMIQLIHHFKEVRPISEISSAANKDSHFFLQGQVVKSWRSLGHFRSLHLLQPNDGAPQSFRQPMTGVGDPHCG